MMYRKSNTGPAVKALWFAATAAIAIFIVNACDNSIDPFNPPEQIYSVYAAFDLNSGSQFVRVGDMTQPVTEDATRELNAEVELEHIESGQVYTLSDSIVRFNGVYTHNFYTDAEIIEENNYLIRVTDSGGNVEEAAAQMPSRAGIHFDPVGQVCSIPVTVEIGPLNGGRITPLFAVEYDGEIYQTQVTTLQESFFDENNREFIRFSFRPQEVISEALPLPLRCFELDTDIIYIEYLHIGPVDEGQVNLDNLPVTGKRFIGYHEEIESVRIDTACASYDLCF